MIQGTEDLRVGVPPESLNRFVRVVEWSRMIGRAKDIRTKGSPIVAKAVRKERAARVSQCLPDSHVKDKR
jgi:hypothetical protein